MPSSSGESVILMRHMSQPLTAIIVCTTANPTPQGSSTSSTQATHTPGLLLIQDWLVTRQPEGGVRKTERSGGCERQIHPHSLMN